MSAWMWQPTVANTTPPFVPRIVRYVYTPAVLILVTGWLA